jgi:hypothetical protein
MWGLHEIVNRWRGAERARYRLVPLDIRNREGRPLPLRLPAVLGRSADADVQLDDPWISRIHCELFERDRELMVRDLESRHGVFVNEERVLLASLSAGDVLLLGVTCFRVECDAAADSSLPVE